MVCKKLKIYNNLRVILDNYERYILYLQELMHISFHITERGILFISWVSGF